MTDIAQQMLQIWGVTSAVRFIFYPIMEELAKSAAKDWVVDYLKSCLTNVLHGSDPESKVLRKALGKAIKEFLELFQLGLEDAEIDDDTLKEYTDSLNQFLKHEKAKEILGNAFKSDCTKLDATALAKIWNSLDLHKLPDDFDWNKLSTRYLKKVQAIRREDVELREILDSEAVSDIAHAVEELTGPIPSFDLSEYKNSLQNQYAKLRIDSLDTSAAYYDDLKLWKIFVPQNVRECREYMPQIYELPKEYIRRLRDTGQFEDAPAEDELEYRRRMYMEQPAQSVLELIENDSLDSIVVLGDPGSGKSSFLQYVAMKWAELPTRELPLHPLPILIELRSYAREFEDGRCNNFLEFCHCGSVVCNLNQNQLDEVLKTGNALVMFDGLDEVFDPVRREQVMARIQSFRSTYSKVRIIVTSRVIGYKHSQFQSAGFRHYLLQDLDDDQIAEFIDLWHNLTYTDDRDRKIKRARLIKAIEDNVAIRTLAANPLLLTMMAILNRNQELPRDRAELYNQASRVLLQQWDVERQLIDARLDPQTIDYKDKQALLKGIAHFMQSGEQGLAANMITRDALEQILSEKLTEMSFKEPRATARCLIEALRERNFILCYLGADCFAFVHRTFLEYFCAAEFVDMFEKRQVIDIDELKSKVYGNHWNDESWHEVLRLIAGMINADFVCDIIEYLAAIDGENHKFMNLFLAADCFGEIRNRISHVDKVANLQTKIIELIDYDVPFRYDYYNYDEDDFVDDINRKAVQSIARNWKDDSQTYLLLKSFSNEHDDVIIRYHAVYELARCWRDDPDTLPWLKEYAHTGYAQIAAIRAIGEYWRDDENILFWLKDYILSGDQSLSRYSAVEAISEGRENNPDVLHLLKDCAQNDVDGDVRASALQAIAKNFKNIPDVLQLLKDCAQNDVDQNVRASAIQAIGKNFKDIPDLFPLLKDRAINDGDWRVRRASTKAIAEGWKSDPNSLNLLKDQALNDEDASVRFTTIETIAENWRNDPDTLLWLKDCTLDDDDDAVRSAALLGIAKYWGNDPDTLIWLKARAVNDVDEGNRQNAVEAIADGLKEDPDLLNWLKERATNDVDENVRATAVRGVGMNYKNDPNTLSWLSTALQKYTNVFSAIRQSGGKEKRNQSEYGPTKHQGHGG